MVSRFVCKTMQPQGAFLLFIFLLLSIANSQTPRTERAVLLGLKKQWGNGAYLYQWNSTSSPCQWPFISCTKGSVTEISLPGMDIRGSFPVTLLCQLKNLSSINFSTNGISGTIPAGISRCSKLETLRMSTNLLTGTIPGELFSMKRLRQLDLRQNMLFGGIPTPLLAPRLETLDLSSNRLSGSIPKEISNLYNLVSLDLSANSFSGPIPAAFSYLYSLSRLSLAFNNLSGTIPVEFGQQLHLKDIDVSHNQLSGDIWGTFYTLTANLTLSICSNHLSGRIPENLVNNRFPKSCFDRENLCSSVPTSGLPRCVSDSCSDHAFQGQKSCKSMPSKRKKIIITCGAIAGALIGLFILLAVFRHGKERRNVKDGHDGVSMISYQRLKFNKWEVLAGLIDENLVGNGGSAKVYKVITRRGQSLAVKSIRHEVRQGHMLEKQFLAEVKILGGTRHNNIVKLLCCITGNTTKLIVYEYMDKECLHKWLHGKKNHSMSVESSTQWERRLEIAIGASQGLCHMHHHCHPPIVHRDIKSSNILVDSEFNAKIADFGLAKMLASEGDPEMASAVVGTFGYIAPEYGRTRKVDVKSDVYSFGVVLLELMTGREAVTRHEEVNLAQWAHRHQREGNSVVDALDEEIKGPRHLKEATTVFKLGLACTSILPSRRPSMKDVVHILQRCNENDQSLPGELM